MRKTWLLCVLLGTLAWGQAVPSTPPPAQPPQAPAPGASVQAAQGSATAVKPPAPAAPADASVSVPDTAAVITVKGVCPAQPKTTTAKGATATRPATAAKTPPADCKTVVTKAEFEKLFNSLPNANPQIKRQLAGALPRLIALSDAAKKKGLDRTPQFKELSKIQTMQLLANELQRNIQAEAAKVPEEKIAEYYKSNSEAFEQLSLERLFVPRTRQAETEAKEEKDEKLTEEQQKAKQAEEKAKQEAAEQDMTKLAESLRSRAAAGEDFMKLQKEAFEAAGMKIASPTVALPKVRRTGLPPAHAAVFDLKPGEVSQVINDSGGHYIYKVSGKDQLTLDQAKDEIHTRLQSERAREMMDEVNSSFTVETNEAYFGPGGVPLAPPRMPNRPMPPRPAAPAPQPQAPPPPPAQPPAAKPN